VTNRPDHLGPSRPQVLLVADGSRDDIRTHAKAVRDEISGAVDVVGLNFDFTFDVRQFEAEFVSVLGGDGSILRAARPMGPHQKPVIGINLGKLGFLADVSPDVARQLFEQLAAGQFDIVDHLMFDCVLQQHDGDEQAVLGLNEVAVLAGSPFAILEVQLYVDAELVTTYSCDGLIISTPVGSTAHSLSAGGPILRKNLQAFVISPISPHTLTNRPVVDTAERVYELVVPSPHEGTALVVDGQMLAHLRPGDRVRITQADAKFQLVEFAGHGYYRTLREKLNWGGNLRNMQP